MDLRARARERLDRIAATTGLKPIRALAGPVGATIRLSGRGGKVSSGRAAAPAS